GRDEQVAGGGRELRGDRGGLGQQPLPGLLGIGVAGEQRELGGQHRVGGEQREGGAGGPGGGEHADRAGGDGGGRIGAQGAGGHHGGGRAAGQQGLEDRAVGGGAV